MELSKEDVEHALGIIVTDIDDHTNTPAKEAFIWWRNDRTTSDKNRPASDNSMMALFDLDTPYVRSLKVRLVIAKLES